MSNFTANQQLPAFHRGSSHSNCLAMEKARLQAGGREERKWVGKRDAHNASKTSRFCIVGDWEKLPKVNEADWMPVINQSFKSFRNKFLTWSSSSPSWTPIPLIYRTMTSGNTAPLKKVCGSAIGVEQALGGQCGPVVVPIEKDYL